MYVCLCNGVTDKDIAKAVADAAPKIAGDDEMDGGAKNPEQFDEPDDDALEEVCA